MVKSDYLKNFVNLSNILGSNAAYVQGGGGNTSVKDENQQMIIKASGLTLIEVTSEYGYTVLDFPTICDISTDDQIADADYGIQVSNSIIGDGMRPSMETGFHAALGPAVAHTHSVYANILTCSKEGPDIIASVFPNAIWVPYLPPGRDLTRAILNYPNASIFFLQNHGIIVSGGTCAAVLQMHEILNAQIIEKLKLPFEFGNEGIASYSLSYMREHILFPDQVIYTSEANNLSNTEAGKATIAAYSYIHRMIDALGFEPRFLKSTDADFLLNMESEKYRQTVAGT